MKKLLFLTGKIHGYSRVRKLLMIMKLSILLLCFFVLKINATVWSQEAKVSLDFKNTSLIKVFDAIENQTDIRFVYKSEDLNQLHGVSIEAINRDVKEVLQSLFNQTNLHYRILEDGLVVITNQLKQGITVTGKVTDISGIPLPGVNILEKGTANGVITDLNGAYTISAVSEDAVLSYSYIGYLKEEIKVDGQTTIDVILVEDILALDEVVVVGYGTQKKSDLTGSIAVVSGDEIKKTAAPTIDRALQGKAPGLWVTSTSGMPGSGLSIKIRGIGSITAGSEPLYVIDGIPGGNLQTINPADIKSIQILKDASATAIYGSRGANGVILISTNRGESGKPKMNISAYTGFTQMAKKFDVLNAQQYAEFYKIAYDTYNHPDRPYPQQYTDSVRNVYGNTNTDWQDLITQVGKTQNINLSVSGGGENSNFALSGNYYNESGILVDTDFERFTLRANSDFRVKEWFTIGESMSISRTTTNNPGDVTGNPWVTATIASPLMPVYSERAIGGFEGPTDSVTAINERTNPLAEQMLNKKYNYLTRLVANSYAEINFLKNFRYKINVGLSYNLSNNYFWRPKYELGNLGNRSNNTATREENYYAGRNIIIENTLTFQKTFGSNNITLLAGHTTEQFNSTNLSATGQGFTNPDLNVMAQASIPVDVDGVKGIDRMESLLGRIFYDYAGKYLVTASIRRDGSSKFGPLSRYGVFPSFSIGWKFNEDLLPNIDWINLAKIRFGWGATGNANIGSFQFVENIEQPDKSQYVFGVDQTTYYGAAAIWKHGNPAIQWETAYMTNFGIDINAFKNKLEFTLEYYYKNQKDMLVETTLSYIYGKSYEANPPTNLGEVINKGLETNLIYKKREGKLNYNITFNLTTLKNEVKYLPDASIVFDNKTITSVGHTIGSHYGFVAERILQIEDFDKDGKILHAVQEAGTAPGDIKFKDLNKDGVINTSDRTIIGKALPNAIFGLTFEAFYKGFDFTILINSMLDYEVYNAHWSQIGLAVGDATSKDNNKHVDAMDYWTEDNRSNTQTRPSIVDENNNSRISSWFLEDASFARIKNLQLGYTLPQKFIGVFKISRLRVYANATNLYTLTKYKGYDPEVGSSNPLSMGIDNGYYPIPRTYLFGLQIDF